MYISIYIIDHQLFASRNKQFSRAYFRAKMKAVINFLRVSHGSLTFLTVMRHGPLLIQVSLVLRSRRLSDNVPYSF